MGYNFYIRQLEATGDCPGYRGAKGKKKKPTVKSATKPKKADLVKAINITGIDKLIIPELVTLELVLDDRESHRGLDIPEGRLKQP